MLRKLVLCLLLAWLPLQGVAAVTMPFCRHGSHETAPAMQSELHAGLHGQHAHEHGGTHHAPAPESGHGALTCNDCGSCHLACAPALLAQAGDTAIVANPGEPPVPSIDAPPAVVLHQPHPPPLLRG